METLVTLGDKAKWTFDSVTLLDESDDDCFLIKSIISSVGMDQYMVEQHVRVDNIAMLG